MQLLPPLAHERMASMGESFLGFFFYKTFNQISTAVLEIMDIESGDHP